MRIDVEDWGVDLLSLSAHKAYGPKGAGVLYVEGGPGKLPLQALTRGGGQESALRPGTHNVPGIAGFGEACRIISEDLHEECSRFSKLRDQFETFVLNEVDFAEVIGCGSMRLPSTSNIRFRGVEAEAIMARLSGVALSTGSACEAGAPEPSHVLQAVGLDREAAYQCIRVCVGRFTTDSDIRKAASAILQSVRDIQNLTNA